MKSFPTTSQIVPSDNKTSKVWALTTKASQYLYQASFALTDTLLFGPETRGLPQPVLDSVTPKYQLRIPMQANNRSLNLSNAVAIAGYEVWRQLMVSDL